MSDLGGLGTKEGAAKEFAYTPPSVLPRLLPWILLLLLFLLPINRCAQAWWVLVPLAAVGGVSALLGLAFAFGSSEPVDLFRLVFSSVAFGIAALWLVSGYMDRLRRPAVFFLALLTVGVAAAIAYACRADWETSDPIELGFAVFPAVCVLIITLAMTLAALMCRRRYYPLRLVAWLSLFLVAGWLLTVAPVVVISYILGGMSDPRQFFGALVVVPIVAALTLAVLLPFLFLSFLEPFYRKRVIGMWRLPGATAPAATPASPEPPA